MVESSSSKPGRVFSTNEMARAIAGVLRARTSATREARIMGVNSHRRSTYATFRWPVPSALATVPSAQEHSARRTSENRPRR